MYERTWWRRWRRCASVGHRYYHLTPVAFFSVPNSQPAHIYLSLTHPFSRPKWRNLWRLQRHGDQASWCLRALLTVRSIAITTLSNLFTYYQSVLHPKHPAKRPDGTKAEVWKNIARHWTEDDSFLGSDKSRTGRRMTSLGPTGSSRCSTTSVPSSQRNSLSGEC